MKSGYKLFWSVTAIADLKNIIQYLEQNWTEKEINQFAIRLEKRLHIISSNPRLFPETSKRKRVRKSVLTKHTVIYYFVSRNLITIARLFDPRQDPKKLNL